MLTRLVEAQPTFFDHVETVLFVLLLGRVTTGSSTAAERRAAADAFLSRVVFGTLFPRHLYPEIQPGRQACASELVLHLLDTLRDAVSSVRSRGAAVPPLEFEHRIRAQFPRRCTGCDAESAHV